MRALFLLLLLVNLLYLAWTQWVAAPAHETPVFSAGTQAASTPIRLRQEVAADESKRASTDAASLPDHTVAATCLSLGPFLQAADAAIAAQRLQRLGFVSHARAAADDVRVGLWVRVADLATPDDAANALVALKSAGFTDAYVVSDGTPGNVVSVGVFSDRVRAEQAAGLVRKAGFVPETSDRLRSAEVVWVDIDLQDNGSLPGPDAVQDAQDSGSPVTMRACPTNSGDGSGLRAGAGASPAG